MSTGQESKGLLTLLSLVEEIYPNAQVVREHHIGKRLRLDIYLPRFKLAFEYDGRQHGEFVKHFHGNREGWVHAVDRDVTKDQMCKDQGITLIRMGHSEPMEKDYLVGKIMDTLDGSV